jgi:hypothetical protein
MNLDPIITALAIVIDPDSGPVGPCADARALAREAVELVRDRGVGDCGDMRVKVRELARHFPRTRAGQ